MTRRSFNILLIIFFSYSFINAQTILSIQIDGNKNFPENIYKNWIKINPGSKIFEGIKDTIANRLKAGLNKEGFFNASIKQIRINPVDTSSSKIFLEIDEDKPTTIARMYFNNTDNDSIYISRNLEQLSNQYLTQSNIRQTISEILDYFENNGYPFSKIKIESIYFFDDSTSGEHLAGIYFNILKGEKSKIDLVEFAGNTKTKDNVILRASGIYPGEIYEQKTIDGIQERLNRLRFFEPVDPPEYYFNSRNQGVLKITVKEKETNNFDGIFGYVPSYNDNENGYFTGYINISIRNLFGTGRSAAFKWQQENRNSQELELRYLEPWLFNYPFNLEAGLYQRKQDSTYVQRSVEAKLEFLATQEVSAALIINSESTIPTERTNNIFAVYNSSSFTSGVNLKIDSRDDFYSPRKGILLLNTYKFSSKSINGPKEFINENTNTKAAFQRLELDFSYFTELFRDQVAAFGVHARELRGNDFELSDLYFLGGTSTLRGYREKQFQGNRIFWSNLEYRYLLTKRSFAFLFFDTGYFLRSANQSKNIQEFSEFKTGYGFGLNIETSLGVLGVSFALGKGDSFSEGKIHFGIINEF